MKVFKKVLPALIVGLPALIVGAGAFTVQESSHLFPGVRRKQALAAQQQATQEAVVQPVDDPLEPAADEQGAELQTALPAQTSPPPAAGVDPEGFPVLPDVSSMLGTASQTMRSLTDEAHALQHQIEQSQNESAARMTRQKAAFEKKLKTQEAENRALVAANANVSQEIAKLKEGNGAIRKHAHALQESNRQVRSELQELVGRLHASVDFVDKALVSTDDSNAEELAVLAPGQGKHALKHQTGNAKDLRSQNLRGDAATGTPDAVGASSEPAAVLAISKAVKPVKAIKAVKAGKAVQVSKAFATAEGQEEDDQVEGSDDGDEVADDEAVSAPTSLLAVAERRGRSKPTASTGLQTPSANAARDLVQVLQKSVTSLAEQERASEAQLKSLFIASFKAGSRRHAALIKQQESLNSTRRSLTVLQEKLHKAEAHLQGTADKLHERLRNAGLYIQKLAHVALAPNTDAPRLMQGLPALVSA